MFSARNRVVSFNRACDSGFLCFLECSFHTSRCCWGSKREDKAPLGVFRKWFFTIPLAWHLSPFACKHCVFFHMPENTLNFPLIQSQYTLRADLSGTFLRTIPHSRQLGNKQRCCPGSSVANTMSAPWLLCGCCTGSDSKFRSIPWCKCPLGNPLTHRAHWWGVSWSNEVEGGKEAETPTRSSSTFKCTPLI